MESTDRKPATLNVSLAPELVRFVREKVESGLYTSASEVVRDALRLLLRVESGNGEPRVHEDRFDREKVRAAVAGMKRLRKGRKLGPDLTIRDLIDEGRS